MNSGSSSDSGSEQYLEEHKTTSNNYSSSTGENFSPSWGICVFNTYIMLTLTYIHTYITQEKMYVCTRICTDRMKFCMYICMYV